MVVLRESRRRCDERCYDAKRLGCRCVCGGKNHGKGLEHALAHSSMFGGQTFDELATDEMREDALMEVGRREAVSETFKEHFGAFEVHGTRSGRLDSTKQNESATPKSVDEDDRSLEAWSDLILKKEAEHEDA